METGQPRYHLTISVPASKQVAGTHRRRLMALVRCVNHKPTGDKKNYVADVNPVGYPKTAAVCGRKECPKPGKAWFTEEEFQRYQKGATIFALDSNVTKIAVEPFGG